MVTTGIGGIAAPFPRAKPPGLGPTDTETQPKPPQRPGESELGLAPPRLPGTGESAEDPARTDNSEDEALPDDARRADALTDQAPASEELTEEERRQIAELRRRDQEVRRHEQAHLANAGSNARGGARFELRRGPDGRQYAVGGEVSIDVSPVPGDPQATIRKAQAIRRAALAPADPSAADRAIAAQASQMEQQARQELRAEQQAETANDVAPVATSTTEANTSDGNPARSSSVASVGQTEAASADGTSTDRLEIGRGGTRILEQVVRRAYGADTAGRQLDILV